MEQLRSKPTITLYIWLDFKNGEYRNIGYIKFSLNGLATKRPKLIQKSFYDFQQKKMVILNCEHFELREKVISAISAGSSSNMTFSVYFMPNLNKKYVKLSQLEDFEGDKLDPIIYKAIKNGKKSELFSNYLSVRISYSRGVFDPLPNL